jgi:hypothetical protein
MGDRSRTRIENGYSATTRRYVNDVLTHTIETDMLSGDETMFDYVSEKFHTRVQDGEIINNPMSYVKNSFKATGNGLFDVQQGSKHYELKGPGSMTTGMAQLLGYTQGFYLAAPTPPSTQLDWSRQQAMGNLDRSPYAFAEDIAEWRQMLTFMKSPFKSLRDLSKTFDDYKQWSLRKRAFTHAKAVAAAWTEYQFAFLPLVRSVNDLIDSFNSKENPSKRRTARGEAEWTGRETGLPRKSAYVFESTASTAETWKSGILYELTNPVMDWRTKYGLRFKDIPETLWAIFPYSFMVDRVSNFSQGLRGIVGFLDPNVKILAGWSTQKKTIVLTRSFMDYDYIPGVTAKNILPDLDTKTSFEYNRLVWEPSIQDTIPIVDLPNLVDTSTKIADLAALIIQRIR